MTTFAWCGRSCVNHPRYAEYVYPLGAGIEGEWPSDQEGAK